MQAPTSTPSLPAYTDAVAQFSIDTAVSGLHGDFYTGLNACVECCDRHANSDALALTHVDADGKLQTYSFRQMRELSARIANLLNRLGVQPGDVVAGLLPRTPELLATILGTWRVGAVYQPLFSAFGPKAIEHRLQMSSAKLVVTTSGHRTKLDDIVSPPPIVTVTMPGEYSRPGDIDFWPKVNAESDGFDPVPRKMTDLFLMMSTSGTTGLAKGVPVPLRALLAFGAYMRDAVDLRPEDNYWNLADPGWAYGLYYAVIGPLLLGHATTFYEGPFSAKKAYDVIERLRITSLAGSPTAFRMMAGAGSAHRAKGRLRVVSSAGEPLNPQLIRWFAEALSVPIYDQYGQTELGMVVNNHHGLRHAVRPGSAGYVMPGYRAVVLDNDRKELPPNRVGELAIDISRSPFFWFTGYWQKETPAICSGYYTVGDNAVMEPDGRITIVGRADDVITSSGFRIGPFEVESALLEHPAVSEVAVIGVPDADRTEKVKAFVVLASGFEGTPALADEIRQHAKRHLSAHAYPRAIEFIEELPKTPSGKIQRAQLRRMEDEERS